jgi:hypothetical protein
MVQGVKINEVTEGRVTVSVWKATAPAPNPPPGHHYNVKVDVGVDWVCIGGGGRGTYRYPANSTRVTAYSGSYLTASFPSDDFTGWNVMSRDHIHDESTPLTGFASAKIEPCPCLQMRNVN